MPHINHLPSSPSPPTSPPRESAGVEPPVGASVVRRSARRQVRPPWIGGIPSFAIHGLVMIALASGTRAAIAPSESGIGRMPLGCSSVDASTLLSRSLPPPEAISESPEETTEPARLLPEMELSDLPDEDPPEVTTQATEPVVSGTWDASALFAGAAQLQPTVTPGAAPAEASHEDAAIATAPAQAKSEPESRASSAQPSTARMLTRVDPTYPRAALRLGRQGVVHVRMTVAVDGRVIDAVAEISSGWTDLDESALTAVRQWRFEPILDGDTRPRVLTIDIRFQLKG